METLASALGIQDSNLGTGGCQTNPCQGMRPVACLMRVFAGPLMCKDDSLKAEQTDIKKLEPALVDSSGP